MVILLTVITDCVLSQLNHSDNFIQYAHLKIVNGCNINTLYEYIIPVNDSSVSFCFASLLTEWMRQTVFASVSDKIYIYMLNQLIRQLIAKLYLTSFALRSCINPLSIALHIDPYCA